MQEVPIIVFIVLFIVCLLLNYSTVTEPPSPDDLMPSTFFIPEPELKPAGRPPIGLLEVLPLFISSKIIPEELTLITLTLKSIPKLQLFILNILPAL